MGSGTSYNLRILFTIFISLAPLCAFLFENRSPDDNNVFCSALDSNIFANNNLNSEIYSISVSWNATGSVIGGELDQKKATALLSVYDYKCNLISDILRMPYKNPDRGINGINTITTSRSNSSVLEILLLAPNTSADTTGDHDNLWACWTDNSIPCLTASSSPSRHVDGIISDVCKCKTGSLDGWPVCCGCVLGCPPI